MEFILEENKSQLLIAPAAKKNHHAVRSGLLYHTTTMLRGALTLSSIYTFLNKNLLYTGVILHDIGKFDVKKGVLKAKHVYNDKEMDEMKKHPMYSYEELQGIPITGRVVFAAMAPARCAAIPAAQIRTPKPLSAALSAKSRASTGVLCAE